MNAFKDIAAMLTGICVIVGILSTLTPAKRTRKIMNLVIGLFVISTIITAFASAAVEFDLDSFSPEISDLPAHNEKEYTDEVAQYTADNLNRALNELLLNEGVETDNIELTLKISDKGGIYVSRAVIYINESYTDRIGDIERIIYANISKEPEIYVEGEKVR